MSSGQQPASSRWYLKKCLDVDNHLKYFNFCLKLLMGIAVIDVVAPKETQEGTLGWSVSLVYSGRELVLKPPNMGPRRVTKTHSYRESPILYTTKIRAHRFVPYADQFLNGSSSLRS